MIYYPPGSQVTIEKDQTDYIVIHESQRQSLFYQGYERWFAAVFWFLLLGPVGAFVYQLGKLCSDNEHLNDDQQSTAMAMVYCMDWIPARLLAFSFALTGDFVDTLNRCLTSLADNTTTLEYLEDCGCAAIGADDYPEEQKDFIRYGHEQLVAIQALLSRSVVAWLVIIAMIQLW